MKVGIIGGGASGMMAAVTASHNHDVTILEHNTKLGKKLLVTGNGRCNYTNSDMDMSHFHGTDISFISDIIKRFDHDATVQFFKQIGIYPKSRNGYIYPNSDQASAMLECLLMEIKRCHVNVITDCNIAEITKNKSETFTVVTDKGEYEFDKLIIATGSYAAPKTGSDGSMFSLLKQFDIETNKPLPALCPLICKENFYKKIAGVRCNACVSIFVNDELKKSDMGELQLTDYGISGIPVFQLSYIAAKALNKKKKVTVELDFMPELTDNELCKLLADRIISNSDKTIEELMVGLLNIKLCKLFAEMISKENNIPAAMKCEKAGDALISSLAGIIKHFKTEIKATNTFENAQVCTGGIKLSELKPTLECKKVSGLYFAGEILDVNGDCGGYNLQWAWSSGYVAGSFKL